MIIDKKEYLSRLKNTSFPEFIYRAKRYFNSYRLKRNLSRGGDLLKIPEIDSSDIKNIHLPSFQRLKCKSDIDSILKGDLLSLNEDQDRIELYEKMFYGVYYSNVKTIDPSIDIRAVWEPARLQYNSLLLLVQCQIKTGVSSQRKIAKQNVLKWINENPFLCGPHYISPMELGLRTPVFLYCLKMFEQLSESEIKQISGTIYEHTWWIFHNLALYSSLGNHTVCESIGLIFGGALFQQTEEGKRWLQQGCELLDTELFHQLLEDGGPAEQSLNYHRFVLDLYWLAIDFLEANRLYDCSKWRNRLNKGEQFWLAFKYDGENVPSIGDSDDGHVIAPGLSLADDLSPEALNDSNRIISGKTFPDTGYTIIKNNEDLFITFDHGPLGMAPLYNHGHADSLAITLYKNYKPFIVDPGTYKYNGVPAHRAYFKGTRAHNTICIDGQDQARQLTGFVWDKPYKVTWEVLKDTGKAFHIQASHDGYCRLNDPVVHTREVEIAKDQICMIVDSFSGEGVHDFELNFHLDPNVKIIRENGWLWLKNGEESICISDFESDFSIRKGQSDPLLGWYSPEYGLLQETSTLHCNKRGTPEKIVFVTAICVNVNNLQKAETLLSNLRYERV
jgi:hypothetical protein